MFQIKEKIISKKNIFCFLLIVIIFLIDRITKIKIINYQIENTKVIFINNYLNLDLIWNTGIGFGLFNFETGIIYHLISIIIFFVILLILYFLLNSVNIEKFSFAIILGGAIGNFYDRITYFAVPDFIDLHYNNYHWFTFNFADIFITMGIIIYLFSGLNKKEIL